jgi:uncharacterized DUF497 family protein
VFAAFVRDLIVARVRSGMSHAKRPGTRFDWRAMDLRPGAVDESGETREEGLGYIGERVYFVVLKERGGDLHFISLRRATASEALDYQTKFFAK